MDVMDIAGMSVSMNQANIMQNVNLSVMRKSLDQMQQNGDALIKMMESSVNPNVGQNIDIRL